VPKPRELVPASEHLIEHPALILVSPEMNDDIDVAVRPGVAVLGASDQVQRDGPVSLDVELGSKLIDELPAPGCMIFPSNIGALHTDMKLSTPPP
jgi:hypothetical protein